MVRAIAQDSNLDPTAADPTWNPLLDAWQIVVDDGRRDARGRWFPHDASASLLAHDARWRATVDYAFAIPTPEALDAIAARGPVVEVGAGTGYWARLLAARGCDVVAYDRVPAGKRNEYHQGQVVGRWFPVVELDAAEAAARHPDRTLLLAWPPYAEDMAFRALDAYRGATVAYVGEGDGGCTADDAFHERLSSAWTDTTYVSLPQWPGLHDALTIYERTGR